MFKKTRCPCCKVAKKNHDLTYTLNKVESLFNDKTLWNEFFFGGNISTAFRIFFGSQNWACDACIDKKEALLANPKEQMYCDYLPFLSYFDKKHNCITCSIEFVFSKEEQLYWYEELNFWVQSEAVNCKECRAKKRARKDRIKRAQGQLQTLLPKLDKANINQLTEIIEYYKLTESHRRVEEYEIILQRLINT